MALQGTIDAFPLTDVLHLLSTSARSGRLVLDGDRGTATLWLEEGRVIGGGPRVASSNAAPSLVFEMLRFADGAFVFDHAPAGEQPEFSVEPTPLAECIRAAAELLEQWAAVEAVVPSSQHRTRLGEPSSFPVSLDRHEWQMVAEAGRRPSVAELAEALGLDEYETATALARLIDRGLVELDEPRHTMSTDGPTDGPTSEPTAAQPFAERPEARHESGTAAPETFEAAVSVQASLVAAQGVDEDPAEFPDRFPIDDLLGVEEGDTDPWISNGVDLTGEASSGELNVASFGDRLPPTYDRGSVPDTAWDELIDDALDAADPVEQTDGRAQDSTDEVLRQMSRLSPQAAEAIAAALNGNGPRGDAALNGDGAASEAVEDEQGPEGTASFLGSL